MKFTSAVLIGLIAQSGLCADNSVTSNQTTSAVPGARFEIVQSPIAAKATFRLDRYTGEVWQTVRDSKDILSWEKMAVEGLLFDRQSTAPRFQIFASGLALRHTYLLDTRSGRTWTFTKDSSATNDISFWTLVEVDNHIPVPTYSASPQEKEIYVR